ncbi:MAG TPA: 50S ribosomal protein L18 [Candidatus Paceibacterota bacterium]|nr:50S ribosomal protein L18 [Candidatus Paceibacterota bacterium]
MTVVAHTKRDRRIQRHKRVRATVSGTGARPRLSVYKSNTALSAQLIDDTAGKTLAAVSTAKMTGATSAERIEAAAASIAEAAKKQGIERAVFDRGGFQFTGVIKAFADAVRAAGLNI